MQLRAKIILPTRDATWGQEIHLPFPPFPGLGIRVDAYDVLNVVSVVVGDVGADVTCIVEFDDQSADELSESKLRALGFSPTSYP